MQYTKPHRVFKAQLFELHFGIVLGNVIMFCALHILLPFNYCIFSLTMIDIGTETCSF
jgi:hypothetical protein